LDSVAFLVEIDASVPEPDDSVATILSSPRKLLSNGASQLTRKGFTFLNNAVNTAKDIGANSDVPYILEDAWSKINIKEDLGTFLQNVVDIVDPVDDGNVFVQVTNLDLVIFLVFRIMPMVSVTIDSSEFSSLFPFFSGKPFLSG
ncbi:hypothetical protein COOONC_26209, partial [Cooperia oncophora]